MSERSDEVAKGVRALEGLRDEVSAVIERRFGAKASLVLTFTLEGTTSACCAIGGDRSVALLGLHDLINRRKIDGPDGPIELQSFIEGELQTKDGDYAFDVGWKKVPALVQLNEVMRRNS
jgi:hypothetical protein